MTRKVARLGDVVRQAVEALGAAHIDNPPLDARILVAHVLGRDPRSLGLDPDREISGDDERRIARLIARRAARVPVDRILGQREFWSLPFRVTRATLSPRPDSETLVEAVLKRIPDRRAPLDLVDFGTGTGCLLLSLLSELPNARGLALDKSRGAVTTARGNAVTLGLGARARVSCADWSRARVRPADVLVSNPPYIPSGEISALAPEVHHDPMLALDGGADGLVAYRTIAGLLRAWLKPGGLVALEVGAGQDGDVAELLGRAGCTAIETAQDLAGIARVVLARVPVGETGGQPS